MKDEYGAQSPLQVILHPSSFILLTAAIILLLTACATAPPAPPPPRLPQWSAIPAAVLESFCANFHDEGISNSITINVVKTAEPELITPSALQALSDSSFYHGPLNPATAATDAAKGITALPIIIPPGCAWRGIAPKTASKYTDTMTLEISPPIVNPYVRNTAGLFARMALADESPTWYWLPLAPRGDVWMAGRLTVLPYRQ
jgi:hypothetical protein